ncbi:uncharacterized protein BT62DRAFT_992758 [Guyanagaster necrorhizus]|uniref:Fungal-type protein kinase domain-containing protein n=1 Tax=Guyanagaster necrorhizus TaxID=856835 RepID=A0A9P8AUT0_9AGAR|nr:uncharacterized protein BT62DRAFT_992758 [Guyanagaster necrorhizus MCA 3950]KAG7448788.1 hypothetical protein BT62DRAFT_992758 [Guyanagaster necrorhizus MCA 3950]
MYIKDTWNFGAHPPLTCIRKHQRTLTVEVGQPLKKFRSSKQLTRVVYEAFLAHEDAFTLCEILHRDVSGGNILIVYDKETPEDDHEGGGRGLLNDWDMAIRMADLDKPARQVERTGTWQFMSIGLLRNRNKKHEAQDDFESFIYVMLHHGLRYMTHSAVGPGLRNIISSIFDIAIDVGNGQWVGALGKGALVHGLGPLPQDFHFACGPFNQWIKHTIHAIKQWQTAQAQQPEVSAVALDTEPAIDLNKKPVFHDHSRLRDFWQAVLEMDGWPRNDRARYQLEPRGNKRPSEDSAQPAPKRRKSGRFTAAAASGNAATPA